MNRAKKVITLSIESLQKEGQEVCFLGAQGRERLKAQGTGHKEKIVENPDPKQPISESQVSGVREEKQSN